MTSVALDAHEMLTCPYIMAHQVERYRMQFHLTKCRKSYPNAKKSICPFDTTHVVNEVELDFHVETCPKRGMFDREAYIVDDAAGFAPTAAPLPNELEVEGEENWDIDPSNSFKPNLENKDHIYKKIKGATPSERRKARMEGMKTYKPNQ